MPVRMKSGEIEVRPYHDGSGARCTVKFDATDKTHPIRIEGSSEEWVWLERDDVMPLIEALSRAYNEVFPPKDTD